MASATASKTRRSAFNVLRFVVAGLLLATAGLKLHGLWTGQQSQATVATTPALIWLSVEVELLLGLWLASGLARASAWAFATAFFAAVTGYSFYLGVTGQESCGCFGAITVHPWWVFSLDVAVLCALVLCRPGDLRRLAWSSSPRLALTAGAALCLLFVGGIYGRGEGLAWLRGEEITVSPAAVEIGEGFAGQERTFDVRVVNHSQAPVKIIGGTTLCACDVSGGLPKELPPGGSAVLPIRVRFTGSYGRFEREFVLMTDSPRQSTVVGRYTGKLVAEPKA
ncbi:MAG: hypothetical protein HYS13_07620 [Planctomycetia bacterium]|nr:hypothetical protein [Planctomycetia bacterium]